LPPFPIADSIAGIYGAMGVLVALRNRDINGGEGQFIDLAITVQTPELQMYQWMFITDTVDAIYPPEDWTTRSLLDRLGEVVRNILSEKEKSGAMTFDNNTDLKIATLGLRCPLLSRVSSTSSLPILSAFLTHISLNSYESLYNSRGQVDWPEVEESLLSDIFSGG